MERIDGVKPLLYLCLFAILSTDLLLVHGQSIETQPQSLTTAEGQAVNLLCRTNAKLSYCRFEIPGESRAQSFSDQWESKNPNYKYFGNGLADGFCGVTIQHVRLSNNGPVKCFLGIEGEEIQSQIELTIAYAPQQPRIRILTDPEHSSGFALDQEIQVACESRDGRPPAKLSWFLNEEPIVDGVQQPKILDSLVDKNATVYTVQQILKHRIRSSDDGKFLICRAEHQTGHPQDTQVPIIVRYQPLRQSDIFVYGLHLSETALVNVTIQSNPRPEAIWSVDGEVIQEGQQKLRFEAYRPVDLGNGLFNITLAIAGLTAEDTAKPYVLKARNQFGETEYLIHITSSPKSIETGIDVGSIVGIVIGIAILLVIISVIVFARATGKWCFSGASINTDIGPDSEAQIAPHHDDYDEKEYDHDTEDRHTETQHTEKNEKLQQQQQQQQQQRNGNEQKTNTPV